jgi:hypothetical protein
MNVELPSAWLIEIYDLNAECLADVEGAIRVMEGVTLASALRDGQPYLVVGCRTEREAIRVQDTVADVDPAAILIHATKRAGESQEAV